MQYTKYLRWALLGGLALVFFTAFIIADGLIIPNMFFPFITGKNFVFRILIEILLGLYVILAVREPKYRPRSSTLLWALCAFMVWIALATIFSVDPIKSFWSNFERMEGYITTLHLFAYFIILGAVVVAEEWWERLFQISIAAGVLQALYSLCQLIHLFGLSPSSQSGPRLDGTFGNATYLAVFMLFNIFITLFMLLRQRKSTTAQALYGIALVLQVAVLYYTETRGALLGVLGGVIIAAIYFAWRARGGEWRGLRKISLWGLGVIAVIVIAFFGLRNTSFVQHSSTLQRIASISLSDPTTQARFEIWHMAWDGFKQSPKTVILGWGQENFNFVFNKYYNPAMYDQEQWFDRAHNQFIDWTVDGGLPAGLLYVAMFLLAAWAIVKSELEVPEQAILLGLLAGYAFNNLFVFDDLMSSVYFFTILALAHTLCRRPLPGRLFLAKPAGEQAVAILAPIVVVVVVVGAWCLNAPGLARAQNLLHALEPQSINAQGQVVSKDASTTLKQFQVALGPGVWPGGPLGQQEVTEQLLQYASNEPADTSVDPSTLQTVFSTAQGALQALMTQRPHDARIELFGGAFYDSYSQFPQALQVLQQALADSPQKQQIMFEVGVTYLNGGDTTDALPILKAAFEEAPGYENARVFYASALYYAGQSAAADQLLIQGFGTVLVDNQQLMQVYVNTKQYSRLVGIWQNRVKADPTNAQDYVGLASAYWAESDKADTIANLQKAETLDPTLATQIDSLIAQINNGTLKPGK